MEHQLAHGVSILVQLVPKHPQPHRLVSTRQCQDALQKGQVVGVENEAALGQTLDVLACRRTPHLAKVLTLTQSPAKCPHHPNLGEGRQHWFGGLTYRIRRLGLHPNKMGKPVWEPKMLDGVDDQTRRRGVCLDHVQAFTQVSPNRSTTAPKLASSRHI